MVGRSRRGGSATPATAALARAGVDHRMLGYDHDAAAAAGGAGWGHEAAAALGVDPARVLKTLVASVDGALAVAVLPVAARLDTKALAAALGGKRAELADPAAARRATGYVVGGISPLGQRRVLPTVVDAGALEHDRVLVSAGRRGLEIELAPADLVRLTAAVTAPLSRRWPTSRGTPPSR